MVAFSLREQVRRVIRGRIIAGQIVPGEIYSIPQFTSLLAVSATPVREALLDLANEGLVEIVRQRGFRVPELNSADIEELVQLRLMLEVPAVAALAAHPPTSALPPLRRISAIVADCARTGDLVGFLENDRDFHLGVLTLFGNQRLVKLVGQLRDHSRLYGLQRLFDRGKLMDSTREHDALLDAIERGDAEQAQLVMRRHLEHARGIWAGREEERADDAH